MTPARAPAAPAVEPTTARTDARRAGAARSPGREVERDVGGLQARSVERDDGHGVLLATGESPYVDTAARVRLTADGMPEGHVELVSKVRLVGLPVATVSWATDTWDGLGPLPVPRVSLDGAALRIEHPPEVADAVDVTPASGLDTSVVTDRPGAVTVALGQAPQGGSDAQVATGPTAPVADDLADERTSLPDRIAVAFGELLGADLSGLVLAAGPEAARLTQAAGAAAVVTDGAAAVAPDAYRPDAVDGLALLDAVVRAWLDGRRGPVSADEPRSDPTPRSPVPAVAEPAAPPAPAPPEPAAVPAPPVAVPGEPTPPETAPGPGADAGAGAATEGEAEEDAAVPAPEAPTGEQPDETAPAEVELLMPPAPTAPGPAQQERLGGVTRSAGRAARRAAALPPAAEAVADARGEVAEPAAETAARASAALTEALGERPPPDPALVALCERIRAAIRAGRPADEDELTRADPESAARAAGSSVTEQVEGDAERVRGSYDALDAPPGVAPALTPTQAQAPPTAVPDPGIAAGDAAPDPVPATDLSLDADVERLEQQATDARVERHSTEPLQGQAPFSDVRAARDELAEVAASDPAEVAATQQAAIDQAAADMAGLQQQALAALQASRTSTVGRVGETQDELAGQEERTRESVSSEAQRRFDEARTQVDVLLTPLTARALQRWDAGVTRLSQEFRDHLARVQRWVDERHSGVGGAIVSVWDDVTGMPDWVLEEYDDAERRFGDGVCELLLSISADVESVIAAAEAVIASTREQIRTLFADLPDDLQEWAAGEQQRFEAQLDGLQARARETREGFASEVSTRAVQAVSQVQAEIEALRTKARGILGRAADALAAFLDDPVKAIIDGLLGLVGIPPASFWALVDRIAQVAADIAEDPERFINNLVDGLKQGFQRFFDAFGRHVLGAFWSWLFSKLSTVGVQLPTDTSPGSILTFALQLMGITWPRIREILVRHVGAENVELVEKVWELVSLLVERGPGGLLEMLRERLDPATIVQTILEAAVEFMVEALVRQVTVRVLALLNPAGAVLQAVQLIYEVLRWVFQHAAQIFALVETVVGGIADVMAGRVGAMAAAVESALASMIAPVIDFLAGLLGLGDLPEQIARTIGRLQTMVLSVVDRVIGALVARGRALLAALGVGGGRRPDRPGEGDDELGTTVRFSAGGEGHRLFPRTAGDDFTLMVASVPEPVAAKIAGWRAQLRDGVPVDPGERAEAEQLLQRLGPMTDAADEEGDRLAREFLEAQRESEGQQPPSDDDLENRERAIATVLERLFVLFREEPDPLLRFAGELASVHDAAEPEVRQTLAAGPTPLPTRWADVQAQAITVPPLANVHARPLNQDHGFGSSFSHEWAVTATLRALREARAEAGSAEPDARRRLNAVLTRVDEHGGISRAGAEWYLVSHKAQVHAAQDPPFADAPTALQLVQRTVWRRSLQASAASRVREVMLDRIRRGTGPPPGPELPSEIRRGVWERLRTATMAAPRVVGEDVYFELDPTSAASIRDYLRQEAAVAGADPALQRTLEWWSERLLQPEFHHAWPQWLGGDPEQTRLHLPRALHNFDGIPSEEADFPGGFHQVFNRLFAAANIPVAVNAAEDWARHRLAVPSDVARVGYLLAQAYAIVLGPFGPSGRTALERFVAEARNTYPHIPDPAWHG